MERRTTVHPNALCALWLLSLFCVSVRLQTVWIRSNRFKISVNIDTTWSVCRWGKLGKCPENTCSSNNMHRARRRRIYQTVIAFTTNSSMAFACTACSSSTARDAHPRDALQRNSQDSARASDCRRRAEQRGSSHNPRCSGCCSSTDLESRDPRATRALPGLD